MKRKKKFSKYLALMASRFLVAKENNSELTPKEYTWIDENGQGHKISWEETYKILTKMIEKSRGTQNETIQMPDVR